MKNTKLIIGLLFLVNFNFVYSQEDDVSQYFDDEGISTANKLIKLGYDPLNGDIPFIFEHQIGENVSLEWCAGLISLKRQSNLYRSMIIDLPGFEPMPNLPKSGFGYSFSVNLRIYGEGYYERSYFGFNPKLSIMAGKAYWDIVFINFGYQFPVTGTWVIDLNTGLCIRTFKSSSNVIGSFENESRFLLPLRFKIGYAF
ncbi:MAG: hypothetical protein ACQES1_06990 [Bacteroidota bacterium]